MSLNKEPVNREMMMNYGSEKVVRVKQAYVARRTEKGANGGKLADAPANLCSFSMKVLSGR